MTIPELVDAAGSALDALERIAAGLVVEPRADEGQPRIAAGPRVLRAPGPR